MQQTTALAALLFVLLASGCNVTKFLPPDEYLYRGAAVSVEAPDGVPTSELTPELTAALNNSTNAKTPLIGYRGIWRYYKFEEKKASKPEKYAEEPDEIKGEKPIFFDELVVENVATLLENRAGNNGYFRHDARYEIDTNHQAREVAVRYTVTVGQAYRLDTVEHFWRDTSVGRIITAGQSATLLRPGLRYDLDRIKAERQRWQGRLREAGYFFASSDDFLFLADTVGGEHEVKMLAKLKRDLPPEHLRPQRITAINVFPQFDAADTSRKFQQPLIEFGGLNIYCDECPLRPEILDEAFAMGRGELYNPTNHRKTLRRLASYNTFRYISMDYEQEPGSDSTLVLNAYMDPLLRRRFEGEVGLTFNSAQYVGPNVRLAYTNRNLLRGAELFKLEGDLSYVVFLGNREDIRVPTSGVYGLTATLNVPRLWLPKRRKLMPRVMTSGTVISLGAKLESLSLTLSKFATEISSLGLMELQRIIEEDPDASERVSLLQLRAQYGYTWRRRTKKRHALNPLAVRLQNPVISSSEVLEVSRSLGLAPGSNGNANGASRFDRMVVFSPNYTLTYDSRLAGLKTHNFFWQQYLSMNWNNIFPLGEGAEDIGRITSVYPQVESDMRYYLTLNNRQQLAVRVHGGVAYPLTERAIVPYFDLYTIGGPNSLRGFAPRQLGPGRTAPENNNLFTFAGYGNLILEGSIEFRQRLNSLIEIAPFFDLGNVWTYKTEAEPLDTDFRQQEFINELAMNYGLGFRFDLQFLILRFDFAKPLQIPYEDTVNSVTVPFAPIGDVVDRGLKFVLAFGYPF